MTYAPTHLCLLGAIGWEHEEWNGSFYPEDMPPEWRLSYYNTLYDCVLLPYADWSARGIEELNAWREDTLERFRFLLEHPPGTVSEADRSRLDALGEKGVLMGPEQNERVVWFDSSSNSRDLSAKLQATAAPGTNFYLLSLDADQDKMEEARSLLEILGY